MTQNLYMGFPESRTKVEDDSDRFKRDVFQGLSATPKQLPSKYLYDQRGSALFDQICELDEYYLTRCELEIMTKYADDMARLIGRSPQLLELGSGSSVKTRTLLDALVRNGCDPLVYMPVDVSREYLLQVSEKLHNDYPSVEVLPIVTDFTKPFALPENRLSSGQTTVYFPGSTIGNFTLCEARTLLQNVSRFCQSGGGLLVGIDLVKDVVTLEAAYNDRSGITAAFNLNLLRRINRELGARIDLEAFEHVAHFNEQFSRIEIFLRSIRDQVITIDGSNFPLRPGECIHTEYSHKYSLDSFSQLASEAGFIVERVWSDPADYFGVVYAAND